MAVEPISTQKSKNVFGLFTALQNFYQDSRVSTSKLISSSKKVKKHYNDIIFL